MQESQGPFSQPWLNDALSAAFGTSLGGLSATFGADRELDACNALASSEGGDMRFSSALDLDGGDVSALGVAAHEVAHALGIAGPQCDAFDTEHDPGEAGADRAGASFERWAAGGFQGPAPRLKPAHGGRAAVHRYSTSPSAITGSPALRYGSRGDSVKTLQAVLNSQGHSLTIDGIFGSMTQAAVISFQRSAGIGVDGVVGPQTAGSLQSSGGGSTSTEADTSAGSGGGTTTSTGAVVTGDPMLRDGDNGAQVSALQTLLNAHGASLSVDGDFGLMTKTAVIAFQRANGLETDGVVGPQTAATLNSGTAQDVSSGGSFEVGDYADLRDAVIAAAESHMGAPYYWGGDGPTVFDCSGFVLYVLRQDMGLIDWGDDTASGISNRVPSTSSPQKGDLVFYRGSYISHIEFATGTGSQTLGASGGGSSTYGNDPNARVKYGDWTRDSRSKSYGSISGLIDAYLQRNRS